MPSEPRRYPDPKRLETKGSLMEALACARTNFLMGYHFTTLRLGPDEFNKPLPRDRTWSSLDKEYADLAWSMTSYRHIELQLWRNYASGLVRALIKESYELTLHYARVSAQLDTFKDWERFPLLRLLRNAMSHTTGGVICWTYGSSPIEWRRYRYTPENDGEHIGLTTEDALDLQVELSSFADEKLT